MTHLENDLELQFQLNMESLCSLLWVIDPHKVTMKYDFNFFRVWKKIQQNTFTRWTNEHLKKIHQNVANLETDLEDGLRLIGLLQVLSGKTLPKHSKKPNFRSQKLENVSVALQFLEKDEGIRIVNIGKTNWMNFRQTLLIQFHFIHLRLQWHSGL